jgi:hypothetical protein
MCFDENKINVHYKITNMEVLIMPKYVRKSKEQSREITNVPLDESFVDQALLDNIATKEIEKPQRSNPNNNK